MTREGRTTVDPCEFLTAEGAGGISTAPYLSILVNNIEVDGAATENTPPFFIVQTLATRGGIAYLSDINEFAEFTRIGRLDRYGLPRYVKLKNNDGFYSEAIPVNDNIKIIPANSAYFPPVMQIRKRVFRLSEIEVNIHQNLKSLRQATAVITDDPDLITQVSNANKQREKGATTVTITKKPGAELNIENFTPAAQCYLNEYSALEDKEYTRLNEIIGVANVGEKEERRIESEIDLIESSSSAIIDTIVSSINKWAQYYRIDLHARRRLSTAPTNRQEEPAEGEEEQANVSAGIDSK